jgi:hypothetical protein
VAHSIDTLLKGIFGDKRDAMEKVTDEVNEQIDHSSDMANKVSEAMHLLEVPTTPQEKYWQALAVGLSAAVVGIYETNKGILVLLEKINAHLEEWETEPETGEVEPEPESDPAFNVDPVASDTEDSY